MNVMEQIPTATPRQVAKAGLLVGALLTLGPLWSALLQFNVRRPHTSFMQPRSPLSPFEFVQAHPLRVAAVQIPLGIALIVIAVGLFRHSAPALVAFTRLCWLWFGILLLYATVWAVSLFQESEPIVIGFGAIGTLLCAIFTFLVLLVLKRVKSAEFVELFTNRGGPARPAV